jgi:energy-coupling factor transporter ATP-binding protein EcfA2
MGYIYLSQREDIFMPRNTSAEDLGIPIGTLVKVTKDGRTYSAVTTEGEDVSNKIASYALKNAFRTNKCLLLESTKNGGTRWSQVPAVEFDKEVRSMEVQSDEDSVDISPNVDATNFDSHEDLVSFISDAIKIKPKKLKIADIWWKFAVRSAIRGENLLVVGPSGCGKTLLATSLKKALGREDRFFYVNMGATQDPRSTLIGNTHYSPEQGTFVALSYFAQAIQVPNAIILLDEISRAHPEAHNILMPVLDATQRYLRVDEKSDSETVKVAPGVTFIATANVGSEYTATRTMDRALLDRFVMMEMAPLGYDDELANLEYCFSNVETKYLEIIAKIAIRTREELKSEAPQIDTLVSTRMAERMASHLYDGFSLQEAAEVCIYPYFSEAGGTESPRTWMRSLVQQHLPTEFDAKENIYDKMNTSKNDEETPW